MSGSIQEANGPLIGIVAGEASGDGLGAQLMAALRDRFPRARFVGIGGPRMQTEGMDLLYPAEKLSVRGYIEALGSLREILAIRRDVISRMLELRPSLFIGVDAPDFNIGVEERLKGAGIPTVQYVSPSIWAWRPERIHRIARAVSHVLALFPFEPAIYEKAGIPVTYVGHPYADTAPDVPDRESAREQLRLPASAPVFALLPGSRTGELKQHADLFVATARRIAERVSGARFLVPLVSRETRDLFEAALYRAEASGLEATLLFGHSRDALIACDVALVASGTATLEAALLKVPMVITYRVPWLTYHIMRRKARIPYLGLPNILSGRFVVPEFVQHDATAENLAQALINLHADSDVRRRLQAHFSALHAILRRGGAQRAADVVARMLGASGHAPAGGRTGPGEFVALPPLRADNSQ